MILLCGGLKGGSGRSSVATHLTILRSSSKDVLLVDADDQETSSDFTILRNEETQGNAGYSCIKLTGTAVRSEVRRIANADKYEDIIIDCGGRDTASQRAAMTVADVMLIPLLPRSFDIWTLEKVSELISEIDSVNPNLKAYAFINRADPSGKENEEAAEIIKEYENLILLPCSLGNRKAFSNAAAAGLAVSELKPKDKKAIKEIEDLYRILFNVK
jgi:chromosome partitioning protein